MSIYSLPVDASKVPEMVVDTQDLASKDGTALQRGVVHPKGGTSPAILSFTFNCTVNGAIVAVLTNPA